MSWSWPKVFVRARSLVVRGGVAPTVLVSPFEGTLADPPRPNAPRFVERLGLASPPPSGIRDSMEDYAELVVALCAYAYPTSELMQRYGIASEDELARVHALWQERLAASATLRARWLEVRDQVARRWAQPAA